MSRTIVVVGGTSGIGRAIAEGFQTQDDARVIVTGHAPVENVKEFGAIETCVLDVRDAKAVIAFFSQFSSIDVLVNCAGIIKRGGAEFTHEGFAEVLDINLTGTLRCCEAAWPALRQARGCVINTASMLTFFGSGAAPAYAASKGGIGQLTRSLAIAWAAEGVRVNALAPGWIETNLTAPLTGDDARSSAILSRTPMNRWGRPEDLAGPALFLASNAASFITGAILPVDGGYSAA